MAQFTQPFAVNSRYLSFSLAMVTEHTEDSHRPACHFNLGVVYTKTFTDGRARGKTNGTGAAKYNLSIPGYTFYVYHREGMAQ